MTFAFDSGTFILAALAVGAAYVVFGISAFGAALFTVPVLSHFLPLEFVLPLCVLLDVTAALALGVRFSREADWSELKWMVPLSAAGALAGVTLLVNLPRAATIAGIGAFLLAYALYSLRQGEPERTIGRGWAPVAGFVGGACGTLFGVGAPPYAIYLAHRLREKLAFRATLSNMVIFSVSIRALVFTAGGLMTADRLAAFAALAPFALAGLWIGNRLQARISRAALRRVVSALLLGIGLSLLARALAGG
ncbi:MAG TPA: sulfite exporter TauE/SafE family protein [Burkholderiales bacterium]|nr:sulfite exporter TauE/SafE family protein [Burkholderiales bacterium]